MSRVDVRTLALLLAVPVGILVLVGTLFVYREVRSRMLEDDFRAEATAQCDKSLPRSASAEERRDCVDDTVEALLQEAGMPT